MKIRYSIVLLAVFLSVFMLSGCSLNIKTPDLLMTPPKPDGKYQDLQEEFERAVTSEISFIIPVNGKYSSAFIIEDMNNDGKEDAMVFYNTKDDESTTKMSVFKKDKDDDWKFIKTIKGAGNSVETVIIDDINKDNIKEVIVGWNLFTSKKQFTVYEPENRSDEDYFRDCGSYPYDLVTTADINSDEKNELVFTSFDSTVAVPEASASIAEIGENGKIKITDRIVLDSNISGYSGIYKDVIDGRTVIYADALKNEHDMITEIIMWDKDSSKLVDPVLNQQNHTNTATWRNSRIPVRDFDGDGHLEIPAGVEIPDAEVIVSGKTQEEETICFTCWSSFNGTKLKAEKYMIYNEKEGYSLTVPSSWIGKISVISRDSQYYFRRWYSGIDENDEKQLFSIVSHTTEAASISDYQNLVEFEGRSFEYNITKDGKAFGIKDEQIKKGFELIDKS